MDTGLKSRPQLLPKPLPVSALIASDPAPSFEASDVPRLGTT